MKNLKKIISIITAMVLAMCLCVISTSAETIFDTKKVAKSGKTHKIAMSQNGSQEVYKFNVTKKGTLKFSVQTDISKVYFYITDANGEYIDYTSWEDISGKAWRSGIGWYQDYDSTTGLGASKFEYEVNKGTHYLIIKRDQYAKGGENVKFTLTIPGADTVKTETNTNVSGYYFKTEMDEGSKITLFAMVDGKEKTAEWKSSDPKIAKVSTKGKVTAIKEGTVTITAKVNGKVVLTMEVEVV